PLASDHQIGLAEADREHRSAEPQLASHDPVSKLMDENQQHESCDHYEEAHWISPQSCSTAMASRCRLASAVHFFFARKLRAPRASGATAGTKSGACRLRARRARTAPTCLWRSGFSDAPGLP